MTDIRDAIALVSSVAEPTEYRFGAEAFEAAYPKMDSGIKPEEKAPSVPKTGKARWLSYVRCATVFCIDMLACLFCLERFWMKNNGRYGTI